MTNNSNSPDKHIYIPFSKGFWALIIMFTNLAYGVVGMLTAALVFKALTTSMLIAPSLYPLVVIPIALSLAFIARGFIKSRRIEHDKPELDEDDTYITFNRRQWGKILFKHCLLFGMFASTAAYFLWPAFNISIPLPAQIIFTALVAALYIYQGVSRYYKTIKIDTKPDLIGQKLVNAIIDNDLNTVKHLCSKYKNILNREYRNTLRKWTRQELFQSAGMTPMEWALHLGRHDIFEHMLKKLAPKPKAINRTALLYYAAYGIRRTIPAKAVFNEKPQILEKYLARRAELTNQDFARSMTILINMGADLDSAHLAAILGYNLPALKLSQKLNIAYQPKKRLSVTVFSRMHYIAARRASKLEEGLITQIADHLKLTGDDINKMEGERLTTPLLAAIIMGNKEMVEWLVKQDDLDTTTHLLSATAIHIAVIKQQYEILKLLLESRKFDINSTKFQGFTPLDIATWHAMLKNLNNTDEEHHNTSDESLNEMRQRIKVLREGLTGERKKNIPRFKEEKFKNPIEQLLEQYGAERSKHPIQNLVISAIKNQEYSNIIQLIDMDNSVVNKTLQDGSLPIHLYASMGPTDLPAYRQDLLHRNAAGQLEIETSLLPDKIDHQNNKGDTALHIAMRHHFLGLAMTLFQAGANEHIKNNAGLTPLQCALEAKKNASKDNIAAMIEVTEEMNNLEAYISKALEMVTKRANDDKQFLAITKPVTPAFDDKVHEEDASSSADESTTRSRSSYSSSSSSSSSSNNNTSCIL